MWLQLLAAVTLLALSNGLDPRAHGPDSVLEFVYRFEGRVAADIGGLAGNEGAHGGEQMAGAAIRGTITVQKTATHSLAYKLTALEVGSHHASVECSGMARMRVQYRPIRKDYLTQLSKPFFFTRNPNDGTKSIRLEVPADDQLWMINVRKSIVNNFQDYFLSLFSGMHSNQSSLDLSRHGSSELRPEHSQVQQETTLFGNCNTWYTCQSVTPSELEAARGSQPMHQDLQTPDHQGKKMRTGQRIAVLDFEKLLKITRVIDHDSCTGRPYLVRANIGGNFTEAGKPKGDGDLVQRHSTYTYYTRGDPYRFYRIEYMEVQGFFSYNPFGFRSEQLQTVTNQSAVLLSTDVISVRLTPVGRMQVVGTIKQGVMSPYSRSIDGEEHDWVHYNRSGPGPMAPVFWEGALVGQTLSQGDIAKYKEDLWSMIQSSAKLLQSPTTLLPTPTASQPQRVGGSTVGAAAGEIYAAQRIAAALPTEALRGLWDQSNGLERDLLTDVLASSGSGPAVQLVLELMSPGSPSATLSIPVRRHVAVLLALASSLPDPGTVPHIVHYLLSLSLVEEPVVGPIVLVSGARLLRRVCAEASAATSAAPLYGAQGCAGSHDVRLFRDYLVKKIENGDPYRWVERTSLLQAYVSLGGDGGSSSSSSSGGGGAAVDVELLLRVARADDSTSSGTNNIIVRSTAIYGLGARYLEQGQREQALGALWSLVLDPSLPSELRQSAVAALLSWQPGQHHWDQLAQATWSNSSAPHQLAHYLHATITATAGDTQGNTQQSECARSALRLARPMDRLSLGSRSLFLSARDNDTQTGYHWQHSRIQGSPYSRANQLYDHISLWAGALRTDPLEIAVGFNNYPDVAPPQPPLSPLEGGSSSSTKRQESAQMKLLLKVLNYEVFLPIDFQEFGVSRYSGCPLCDLLWYNLGPCGAGGGDHVLQYSQPAGLELFVPNEMGLPILAELVSPSVLYSNSSLSGSPCRQPGDRSYSLTTDTKLVSRPSSVLKVMVPWLDSTVAAGVDLENTLTLPLQLDGTLENHASGGHAASGASSAAAAGASGAAGRKTRAASGAAAASAGSSAGRRAPYVHRMSSGRGAAAAAAGRIHHEHAITASMRATRQEEFPVVLHQSVPYTVIKPLRPGNNINTLPQLKVMRIGSKPVSQRVSLLEQFTGIAATLQYQGDLPFPFTMVNALTILRNPSRAVTLLAAPTPRYSRSILTLHPHASTNTECTFTLHSDSVPPGLAAAAAAGSTPPSGSQDTDTAPPCPADMRGSSAGVSATFSASQRYSANWTAVSRPPPPSPSATTGRLGGRGYSCLRLRAAATAGNSSSSSSSAASRFEAAVDASRPVNLTLPQLSEWLQQQHDLDMTANMSLWGSRSAQQQQQPLPLLAGLQVSAGVSAERRQHLQQVLPSACSGDLWEPASALGGRAVYDALTASNTAPLSPSLHRAWSTLKSHVFALMYPNLLPDYLAQSMVQPRDCDCAGGDCQWGNATITANRSLSNHRWSAICQDCQPPWHGSDISSWPLLDKTLLALATQELPPSTPAHHQHQAGVNVQQGYHRQQQQHIQQQQELHREIQQQRSSGGRSGLLQYPSSSSSTDGRDIVNSYPTCWTNNIQVQTFDGLRYNKTATGCYQLLLADCSLEPEWYVFTHSKDPDDDSYRSPTLRYFNKNFQVDVEVGKDSLHINGVLQSEFPGPIYIKRPDGRNIGSCFHNIQEHSYACSVWGQVWLVPYSPVRHLDNGDTTSSSSIDTSSNGDTTSGATSGPKRLEGGGYVSLTKADQYSVCGMCGNNNRNPSDDNVGAHLCRYSNLTLMAASWTKDSDCPETEALENELIEVHRIQNDTELCRRVETELLSTSPSDRNNRQRQHLGDWQQRLHQGLWPLRQQLEQTQLQHPLSVGNGPLRPREVESMLRSKGWIISNSSPLPHPVLPSDGEVLDAAQDPTLPGGCMFFAHKVELFPYDDIFVADKKTKFCNMSMNCYPFGSKTVYLGVAVYKMASAPRSLVEGLKVGYVEELPADASNHLVLFTSMHTPDKCVLTPPGHQ